MLDIWSLGCRRLEFRASTCVARCRHSRLGVPWNDKNMTDLKNTKSVTGATGRLEIMTPTIIRCSENNAGNTWPMQYLAFPKMHLI